ncbi:hypothetical protein PHYBLDRAFT_140324 [Phycomyces blakesleeanus NRRL 1555(-)]|uniref:Uncharacterized protein n=1 Tax=Phycomyces blakesleeanus (strain ATCC 8743b / DSM 1359 / FGSC 10004 / NBRC 33097 / NRRL 1555) TaxID=763407 RepID=A0A162UUZ8_PHYB8|nr:hypothetical protein PHYBLDRAFT_140324 [Phycomyces blakesleeanus NRRL 1555(-)]OAD78223.1 hypothetical protein PHYBLDRAFT_140324 [Phycomyces blakesleeanus NRRL 1555(-)]|eukprot:XP_018296263.1 hypothetical protein PHYBLDRAFT_140324 [Phycomyces blakesleeanus NRRL 1555(-)]
MSSTTFPNGLGTDAVRVSPFYLQMLDQHHDSIPPTKILGVGYFDYYKDH